MKRPKSVVYPTVEGFEPADAEIFGVPERIPQERQIYDFKQAHHRAGYAIACFHCILPFLVEQN